MIRGRSTDFRRSTSARRRSAPFAVMGDLFMSDLECSFWKMDREEIAVIGTGPQREWVARGPSTAPRDRARRFQNRRCGSHQFLVQFLQTVDLAVAAEIERVQQRACTGDRRR